MVVAGFLLQPSKQITVQAFIFYKPESSDGIMADTKPARFRVLCTMGSSLWVRLSMQTSTARKEISPQNNHVCALLPLCSTRDHFENPSVTCPHWHICSFHLLFTRFASIWLYLCPDNQHKRPLWHTAGSPIWITQAHEQRDLKPAAMSFWLEVCNM